MDAKFLILGKRIVAPNELPDLHYDVLISSFNDSLRVRTLFERVRATRKIWICHPEYGAVDESIASSGIEHFAPSVRLSETDFWSDFFDEIFPIGIDATLTLAVDITGMIRPHLMLLPLYLKAHGIGRVDFFYSDPESYASGATTTFSKGVVERVGQVPALEGTHDPRFNQEVLIIGAGYDARLVAQLATSRAHASQLVLVGLPGLQPHMYQESQLQVDSVGESINRFGDRSFIYSPANDPWLTAATLREQVRNLRDRGPINLYLAPVGSKAQVLGFAWYFLCDERDGPTSVIFPYTTEYSRETSVGLARTHVFELELDWILETAS